MRMLALGVLLGTGAGIVAFLILRQQAVAPIAGQVGYHFDTCVFGAPDFPGGDLDNGRLLRRALMAPDVSVRFFDAQFHEVTRAEQPGRYGAVVRLKFAATPASYRFITLYRTLAQVRGDFVQIPITAQWPAEFGLDPAIVARQQGEISGALQNMLVDYEESSSPESVAILLAGLAEMKPSDLPAHLHDGAGLRNEAWWYQLQTHLGLAPSYRCLVDLPRGYEASSPKRWPLILFLPSSDTDGSNLDDVRRCALAGLIARGKELPAIVVSPQCPDAQPWNLHALGHELDTLVAQYRIDPDRVYLTGVSAGGDVTWDLALLQPERFAAIVPMSGESDPSDAAQLRGVPVWGFNGEADAIVPPAKMEEMVTAVRQAGGHAHLSLIAGAGHDCWDAAYSSEALWTWLFAQQRGQAEVRVDGTPSP